MITSKRIVVAAAFLLSLGLTACGAPGPLSHAMVCGQQVTYHPDDLTPCAHGAAACTQRQGESSYDVHYSTVDTEVIGHENEHVCGMQHREPWVSVSGAACTEVTDGGTTGWKRGDVMCRVNAGPPLRIVDTRQLATILASADWAPLPIAVATVVNTGSQTLAQADLAPAEPAPRSSDAAAAGDAPRGEDARDPADQAQSSAAQGDRTAPPALPPQDDRTGRGQTLQAQMDETWNLAYGDQPRPGDDFFSRDDDTARRLHLPQGQRRTAATPLLEPRAAWTVQPLPGA